jgi:acylphosphatase
MKQFRAVVSGRVQGVSFRAETCAAGRRLGLAGYARNQPDGTVEVVAAGTEEALQELIEFLHRGPAIARVDEVAVAWEPPTMPPADGFRVRA